MINGQQGSAAKADVGIFLVHGIGEQEPGDTLRQIGEPLFEWVREWLANDPHGAEAELEEATLPRVADQAAGPSGLAQAPANATISIGDSGELAKRWLLAESYWATDFKPPSPREVATWTFGVLPWLMVTQVVDSVTDESALTRAEERKESADWGSRLGVAVQSLGTTLILAFALPFALIVEFVGIILLALSLISPLRRFVGGVQRWLGGSLGDSYALLTSPLATASMLTSIRRSLDWACARSDVVVVLAHSQGAALAHRLLARYHPREVRRLVTFGAAIGKLETLDFVSRSMPSALWASLLASAFSLGATCFFVIELSQFGDATRGSSPPCSQVHRWRYGFGPEVCRCVSRLHSSWPERRQEKRPAAGAWSERFRMA